MEDWLLSSVYALLALMALPQVGLPAIFIVSLISATLLPMGSEPVVFAYAKIAPEMFWPAILVATTGNTIGGAISYAMGAGAQLGWHKIRHAQDSAAPQPSPRPGGRWQRASERWFKRLGARALFFSWLPGIGDPLCAVAGWLRLPFWPSVAYMALGKFLRYLIMTWLLLQLVSNAHTV